MCVYVEKFKRSVINYLNEMRFTGRSSQTVRNYENRLGYFLKFWEDQNPQQDPNKDDVRAWRDSLLAAGTSPATVRQYLVELGSFFSFCEDDEIYEENPVTKKLFPKIRGSKPYEHILNAEQIALLWENTCTGPSWERNYAIIVLLLDGKVRNAELLDMKLSDIDFQFKEVVIPKGKGNKRRVVSLSDISITAIKLYLASGIRPAYCSDDDYLFGTTAGENRWVGGAKWHRGTGAWLSALVEKHVRTVTGLPGFRTHSLRHNGTMFDLNTGISMERLQSELGHSSVTTTEIYAGRLGSRRHQEEFKVALCARDYWAAKNKMMLQNLIMKGEWNEKDYQSKAV